MANSAGLKLPEFWESAAATWFVQAEAQFAIRGITDDSTRYYHVGAALGSSTAARATALANTTISEPRALAEEADRFFLATQRHNHEVLASARAFPVPAAATAPHKVEFQHRS
ncbi:uncharacterized protein LOC144015552 [Festucalex cinctus]